MTGCLISAVLIASGFLISAWLGPLPASIYCTGVPFALVAIWIGERYEIKRVPRLRRAMELYDLELNRFELDEYENSRPEY